MTLSLVWRQVKPGGPPVHIGKYIFASTLRVSAAESFLFKKAHPSHSQRTVTAHTRVMKCVPAFDESIIDRHLAHPGFPLGLPPLHGLPKTSLA